MECGRAFKAARAISAKAFKEDLSKDPQKVEKWLRYQYPQIKAFAKKQILPFTLEMKQVSALITNRERLGEELVNVPIVETMEQEFL